MIDTPYSIEALSNTIIAYSYYLKQRFPDWADIEIRQTARLCMEIQAQGGKTADHRQHMDAQTAKAALGVDPVTNDPVKRVVENAASFRLTPIEAGLTPAESE